MANARQGANRRKRAIILNGNDHYYEFNGTMELFDAIKETPAENRSREEFRHDDFCKYTWAECVQGLTEGWREGTQEIQDIVSKIQSAEGAHLGGHDIEYDVSGDFIDMGAFLTGEPECMGRIVPREIITDEIHILVNSTYSWNVTQETIKTRGAAITALIEKLMDNYAVKLSIAIRAAAHHAGKNIEVVLNIDLQNEFSRDVIAFCAAHPGFFRRIMFALMEMDAGKPNLKNTAYGIVEDSSIILDKLRKNGVKHYYFNRVIGNDETWSSPEAALREVNRIVESLK